MIAVVNVSDIKACRSTAYVVRSPSSSYIINCVSACVVNILFAIAGSFLNSSVVFIFWKSPKLKKKIAYFLIMILSSADLAVTLVVHSLFLVNHVSEITGKGNCAYKLAYQSSQIILSGQSALTLFAMNIERYLSIVHPIFHLNQVNRRKCVAVFVALGLIPIMITLALFFGSSVQLLITVITIIICLESCFVYVSIFRTARRILNRVGVQNYTVTGKDDAQRNTAKERKNITSFLRDLKLAKTSFLVVFCCFVCYLPNGIILGASPKQTTSLDGIVQAKVWTTSFVTINSTINCLIFFCVNREIRQKWRKIMKYEY